MPLIHWCAEQVGVDQITAQKLIHVPKSLNISKGAFYMKSILCYLHFFFQ